MIIWEHTSAQVGVNVLTTHTSAALQVASPPGSFRGLLTPSMSPYNRVALSSGTNAAADGLIVYDTYHRMHYYYHGGINRWASMSPFLLTTASHTTFGIPFGTITTPSSTAVFSVGINKQNPTKELDVEGSAAVSGDLNVTGNFSKTGYPANPFVPAGTIVMWHGNTIPTGWTECNGSNGSPDLRGKFIVAAGQAIDTPAPGDVNPNYINGSKGGENQHVLVAAEIPKHSHKLNGDGATTTASGGNHSHDVALIAGSTDVVGGGNRSVLPTNGAGGYTSGNTHVHNTTDFGGQTGDGTSDGLNNGAHENRPQYYVLRFIMKL